MHSKVRIKRWRCYDVVNIGMIFERSRNTEDRSNVPETLIVLNINYSDCWFSMVNRMVLI